jgi:hypothetical protein
MEFTKTIRLLDPHGTWGDHNNGFYFGNDKKSATRMDTGLCNRIFHWEVFSDLITKSKEQDLHLLVQDKIWPELDLLEFPYTIGTSYRKTFHEWQSYYDYDILHMKTVFDKANQTVKLATPITKKDLFSMYKTQTFNFKDGKDWYSDFGFETLRSIYRSINPKFHKDKPLFHSHTRPLQQIRIKHTLVKEHIEKKYKGWVGIHIRRGNGVNISDDDILSYPPETRDDYRNFVKENVTVKDEAYRFYQDEVYFELIDKILAINPVQRIYISHDLPDNLMQQYFNRYGHHIIETKYNSRYFYETYYANNNINVPHMINYGNVLDNVMDLMTLSHCDFIIGSPKSSWSEFAYSYKNAPWYNINDKFDVIVGNYKEFAFKQKSLF